MKQFTEAEEQELQLKVERYVIQNEISKEFANWELLVFPTLEAMCAMGLRLILRFPAEVLAEYKWPANWKQALKGRFASRWMKRRWPVVYEKIDVLACYNKISIPKEEHFIHLRRTVDGR